MRVDWENGELMKHENLTFGPWDYVVFGILLTPFFRWVSSFATDTAVYCIEYTLVESFFGKANLCSLYPQTTSIFKKY